MTWKLPQIEAAFEEGKRLGASHMIVAFDEFDGENYPIYVKFGEDPKEHFPTNGDHVDEVYSLTIPWDAQSAQGRVWNVEKAEVPAETDGWIKYTAILEEMLVTAGVPKIVLEDIKAGCFGDE